MDHPPARRRLPWGAVLITAALAGALLLTYRQAAPVAPAGPPDAVAYNHSVSDVQAVRPPPSGPTLVAAIVVAVCAFLAGRRLLNSFWGVVLALGIALHPLFFRLVQASARPVAVEAVELACLALLVTAWPLAFAERLRWRSWLTLFVGLTLTCILAWLLRPSAGLVVAVSEALVLLTASLLVLVRRRRPAPRPAGGNGALALLSGLAAPALGFALAPFAAEALAWLGQHGMTALAGAFRPGSVQEVQDLLRVEGFTLAGFTPGELHVWCWPTPWVVLPLAAWGLWRAVRRGRKQELAGRAPVAWVLPLFAAVVFLGTVVDSVGGRGYALLALAVLGVLLAFYCLGDLGRSIAERMMLGPPQEEAAAAE